MSVCCHSQTNFNLVSVMTMACRVDANMSSLTCPGSWMYVWQLRPLLLQPYYYTEHKGDKLRQIHVSGSSNRISVRQTPCLK